MTNPFQPTKQVCLTCKGTKTIHPQNDQCKNLYHQCPTCKGTGEVPAGAQNNGHDFRYVKVSGNRMCSLCGATKNTHEGISPCKVASPKSAELDEVLENWLEKVMSTSTLGWSPIDGYKGNEDESEAVAAQDYDKYKAEAKAAIESIIEGRVVAELEKLASMTDSYNGKVQLLANLVSAIYGRLHELKGDQRAQRCPECHGGTYMPGNADPANCDVCHGTGVAQLPASPEDIK